MNDNGIQATMPVQPANNQPYPVFYGNGGNNGGFDGNNAWWVIILLLAMGRGWGGYGGGNGGGYGGSGIPYIINTSSSESGSRGRYDMQDGFNHAAVMAAVEGVRSSVTSGFGDTQLGIAGIGRQICETGANVTAAVTGAQNSIAQQLYTNQIADLNRSFDSQTAIDSRLDNMAMENQRCCCETKAQIADVNAQNLREHCQDRYDAQTNTRDIIDNANRNNQLILDKLCQLELDGVKQNYENRIAAMQAALEQARSDNQALRFDRSQVAQTAAFNQSQNQQTADLLQRLNPTPIPAYVVQNPNCCNNQFYNGCGCGAA